MARLYKSYGPYRVLYADPNWRFKNWSLSELAKYGERWARRMGRSPYPVMSADDIAGLPVEQLAARDSVLAMWATAPMIADGNHEKVIRGWGFKTVTIGFTWIKLNPSGIGLFFGQGFYSHQNAEYLFIAKKGNGCRIRARDVFSLIFWPRGEHSAKPPIARERLERLFGDVPRIELFARRQYPGWACWGNEVPIVEGSPEDLILGDYVIPPYSAIVDEDEYQGLAFDDTLRHPDSYAPGEQMRLV